MRKITKENIQEYALKLMFKMKEEEFDIFEKEFEIIIKYLSLIEKIDGIEKVKPMTFPFINDEIKLRDDNMCENLSVDDVISNATDIVYDEIKVPKIVGGEE